MELICETLPLGRCRLMLYAGHNRLEQYALTDPGYRPDGEGWNPNPSASFDPQGHEVGWLWTRKLRREGDVLIPVAYEEEDTRPVAVNVVA